MTDPTSSKTGFNLQSFCEDQKVERTLKRDNQNFDFQSNEDSFNSVKNQDPQKTMKIKTKAAREKARREKLNERWVLNKSVRSHSFPSRFTCLANLSNPEDPKTDKASILMDTIRSMKALRLENDQLKQLNKFLEVMILTQMRVNKCDLRRKSHFMKKKEISQSINKAWCSVQRLMLSHSIKVKSEICWFFEYF